MRKKKKYFVFTLTFCLLLVFNGLAGAAALNDVNGHWAQPFIEDWTDSGLVAGYPDGSFKPDSVITRAEFVTLVNKSFKNQNNSAASSFLDVTPSDWYYRAVSAASAAGYVSGYEDNTFKPNKAISRQEAAIIITKILQLTPDPSALSGFSDAGNFAAWSKNSISAVVSAKIMKGYPDGSFMPENLITRAEAVVALNNAIPKSEQGSNSNNGNNGNHTSPTNDNTNNDNGGGNGGNHDAPAATELVSSLSADFDGLLMTNISATLAPTVEKIEIVKAGSTLAVYTGADLTLDFQKTILGATRGDEIIIKAFAGGVAKDYSVIVQ